MSQEPNRTKQSGNEVWKTVLAVILLLFLVVIAGVTTYFMIKYVLIGIAKLVEAVGKIDAVIVVAVISALVAFTGWFINARIEYRNKRREYLAQKREEPYGQFADFVYKILEESKNKGSYNEDEMIKDTIKFSKDLTLWGSPNVVGKWVKFRRYSANPEKSKECLFLMEDILNEMRKDLGVKKTKKRELLKFFINDIN